MFIFFYFGLTWLLQRYYIDAQRELTRLKSMASSPVIQCITEILNGSTTIRIFKKEEEIRQEFYKKSDDFFIAYFMTLGSKRWFSIR